MSSIEQALQLNKLLAEQNKLLAEKTKMFAQQFELTKQIADIQKKMSEGMAGVVSGANDLSGAIDDVVDNIDELDAHQQAVFDRLNQSVDGSTSKIGEMADGVKRLSGFSLFAAPFIAGASGFTRGLLFSINALKTLGSVMGQVTKTVFNLGVSIVALPFKLFNNFLNAGIQGSTALIEAFEAARKTMGALGSNEGAAIVTAFRNMRGELGQTGLSVWRTFGDLAERMQWINETADTLGVTFTLLRDQFAQNVDAIGAYIKGLGLTSEGQKALAEDSIMTGRSLTEIGREVTTMAFGMGKAFGINGKLISRDIGQMANEFDKFGFMSTKTLSSVSVFTRKLGIEIKDLLGIVDTFDNFENAAQSAANLSQAFGLNIDALQMLKEEDPAARIDNLRKAFFAAGKSVENMTRQERALLAQHTGLDQKTAALVFSQQNQALSYEDIQKQSEITEKKQLSQAEAMEQLANSIERLIKQGSKITKGFFASFADGFDVGIRRSKEFRESWQTVQRALRTTRYMGVELGRAFVKVFPGITEMLNSVKDFFNPSRVRAMIKPISDSLIGFFKGGVSLDSVFSTIKTQFESFFDPEGEASKGFMGGWKKFRERIVGIFVEVRDFAVNSLTNTFKFIADWLRSGKFPSLSGATGEVGKWFSENLFNPLMEWLRSEEVKNLKDAFVDMISLAWEKLKDWTIGFAKDNWKVIVAVMFGPAFVTAIINALAVGLVSAFVKGGPFILSKISSAFSGMFKGGILGRMLGKTMQGGIGEAAEGAIGSASKVDEAMSNSKISPGSIKKALIIAAFITVGIAAFTYGILKIAEIIKEKNLSISDLGLAALTIGAAAGLLAAAAGIAIVLDKVSGMLKKGVKQILTGMVAIGVVVASMVGITWLVIKAFNSFDETQIDNAIKSMGMMERLFLAASAAIVVATGVGTAIIGTAGAAGVAAAAGMAALSAAILAMTATANEVIESVNELQLDPGIDKKMEVYNSTMEMIGSFSKNLGSILKAAMPSFAGFVFGESTEKNLKNVAETITKLTRSIIDKPNGLMPSILKATEELSDEQLSKAKGFSGIIDTIVKMVGSIGKSMDGFKDSSAWSFVAGGESSKALERINTFFTETLIGVTTGMKGAMMILSDLNVDPEKTKSIKTMTDIIWSTLKSLQGLSVEKIDNMNKIIPKLPSVIVSLTNSMKLLEAPIAEIQDETIAKVQASVSAMIETINGISKSIKGLGKITLDSDLRVLSDKLGLGANRRLTIEKGDLNINISVNVDLRVDEIEEALTTRSGGSRFQISPNNPFNKTS